MLFQLPLSSDSGKQTPLKLTYIGILFPMNKFTGCEYYYFCSFYSTLNTQHLTLFTYHSTFNTINTLGVIFLDQGH